MRVRRRTDRNIIHSYRNLEGAETIYKDSETIWCTGSGIGKLDEILSRLIEVLIADGSNRRHTGAIGIGVILSVGIDVVRCQLIRRRHAYC